MSASITRVEAFLSMTSPLGRDVLIPTTLLVEETISTPFRIRLGMVAQQSDIDPDRLLAKDVCVTLRRPAGTTRHFHGTVREFRATGSAPRQFWGYAAEIVPRLWFLQQAGDCRIFENRTARQILQQLFDAAGLGPVEFRLYGQAAVRPYTTQFNETDFAFATRLMQEEGWFYFFEHGETTDGLVIADGNAGFRSLGEPALHIDPSGQGARHSLTEWQPGRTTALGKVRLADYDPQSPGKPLDSTRSTTFRTDGTARRDLFHWPARTDQSAEVDDRARRRIEAAEAAATLIEAAGCNETFYPGGRFSLTEGDQGAGGEFVVHSITHQASDESWVAGGDEGVTYRNAFASFEAQQPWRDAPDAPRPVMPGLCSAVVIGPDGEEVYTDELGRVRVRFRWDHGRTATPGATCWVRVMQPWAGPGWGWQHVPRIGAEVAVAFMDGDPDRPVVVGGLYNGEQKPPFPLPQSKTITGLRTRSSLHGGAADCSELSFDDQTGAERVLLHAQKDLRVEVENDRSATVGGTCKTEIDAGRTVEIKSGGDKLTVDDGDRSVTLQTGNLAWKAELGAISGEAMQSIELKVGGNSIKIDQTGITISGLMIKVSGDAMVSVEAPMTKIDADGMLVLQGGLMTLN